MSRRTANCSTGWRPRWRRTAAAGTIPDLHEAGAPLQQAASDQPGRPAPGHRNRHPGARGSCGGFKAGVFMVLASVACFTGGACVIWAFSGGRKARELVEKDLPSTVVENHKEVRKERLNLCDEIVFVETERGIQIDPQDIAGKAVFVETPRGPGILEKTQIQWLDGRLCLVSRVQWCSQLGPRILTLDATVQVEKREIGFIDSLPLSEIKKMVVADNLADLRKRLSKTSSEVMP
jgi:hypothetical protein